MTYTAYTTRIADKTTIKDFLVWARPDLTFLGTGTENDIMLDVMLRSADRSTFAAMARYQLSPKKYATYVADAINGELLVQAAFFFAVMYMAEHNVISINPAKTQGRQVGPVKTFYVQGVPMFFMSGTYSQNQMLIDMIGEEHPRTAAMRHVADFEKAYRDFDSAGDPVYPNFSGNQGIDGTSRGEGWNATDDWLTENDETSGLRYI